MGERPAIGTTMVDVVYYPPGMLSGPTYRKQGVYLDAGPRKSDGIHCLGVMAPGATRRHNIEVGSIVAIDAGGGWHELEVPPQRYRLRAQELVRAIEGDFSEDWARPYFDPASPKYWQQEMLPFEGGPGAISDAPASKRRVSGLALAVIVTALVAIVLHATR